MSDKVVPVLKPGEGGIKQPELPSINNAEWKEANAKHQQGRGEAGCCDCKITGSLDEKQTAKLVEELSKAQGTEKQLAALGKLADGGVDKFSMKDKDGTTRQFRIETEKVNGTTLLHCYGMDEQKQEQVVFRAARSADGTFRQERNKNDQLVSFTGDAWNKSMSGKSFFIGESQKSDPQNKKVAAAEKVGEKKSKAGTAGDDHSRKKIASSHDDSSRKSRSSDGGGRRISHDDDSRGESRTRARHRDDDDRLERRDDRSDRKDHRREDRDDRDRERSRHREKSGSRFNLGEAFGTVVRFAAPFLLSALERNQYSDCNPYREQHRYRSHHGCQDYYGNDRYGYDGYNRFDGYRHGRGQGHCNNDYDRRYGNRNYYDPYRNNGIIETTEADRIG